MIIVIARRYKGERFGARKYAKVRSQTTEGLMYTVAKVRVRNRNHYTYVCTCPHYVFRQKKCKHIVEFVQTEKRLGI